MVFQLLVTQGGTNETKPEMKTAVWYENKALHNCELLVIWVGLVHAFDQRDTDTFQFQLVLCRHEESSDCENC